jgi:asparagine synthase (glutamine-hydrolysing)
MCGIGGFVTAGALLPQAEREARLWRMVAVLRHRGPDDEGVWSDGRVGLAHARLSIIDRSPAGHQPMSSSDGTVWITYNGEIYNFSEIAHELTALGYRLRSRSDTEVIVNGWHAWGPRIFSRLRGMFALALWDRRSRRLVLARDRLGKKPLYWAQTRSGFRFGSEIKALLTWPDVSREPDLAAIDRYLTLQYVPAPHTAFAAVRKLPAAHYLVLAAGADGGFGEPEPVRYWDLPAPRASQRVPPVAQLRHELVELLEEAVRLRLVGEAPLGAFLSGGIDSSAVVAMMARAGAGRVKTFSIGFADKRYDETRFARIVAQQYGTDHQELVVERDALAILPRLVWHYGEPFADPSAIPTYCLAEMARRHITVAMTGDGGDECFLGYPRYRAMRWLARLDHLPTAGRAGLALAFRAAPAGARRRFKLPQLHALLRAPPDRPGRRYAAATAFFDADAKRVGYGEALCCAAAGGVADLLEPYFAAADDLVAGANRADIHTYLPEDLMAKVDIATMAHGLEARSPLLDHVLVEWAARLPTEIKIAGGVTKALFKSAMAPYLPRQIRHRRKRGFGVPIDRWFRNDIKELAYDTLLSPSARQRGLIAPAYVRELLDQHCAGRADHQNRLWALLMLELWFQMWIDAPAERALLRPAA